MGRLRAGRTAPILLLLPFAAACLGEYEPPGRYHFERAADLLLPPAGPAGDTASFVIFDGDEAIAEERFRRTAARLDTELEVVNQARVTTGARLRDDGSVRRLEIRVFPPGRDAADPIGSSAADFGADSLRLEEPIGTRVQSWPLATRVVPWLDLAPSYLEQILRAARGALAGSDDAGDRADVHVWTPGVDGGDTLRATVWFGRGHATILFAETGIRARTDPAGRLLAAVIPAEDLVIVRRAADG